MVTPFGPGKHPTHNHASAPLPRDQLLLSVIVGVLRLDMKDTAVRELHGEPPEGDLPEDAEFLLHQARKHAENDGLSESVRRMDDRHPLFRTEADLVVEETKEVGD